MKITLDKRICKVCNKEKGRVPMGKFPKGVCRRFIDENHQYWNGKVCPDCNNERIKKHMESLREKRKKKNDS